MKVLLWFVGIYLMIGTGIMFFVKSTPFFSSVSFSTLFPVVLGWPFILVEYFAGTLSLGD